MSVRDEHIKVSKSARICSIGAVESAEDVWIACHGYAQLAARFIRPFAAIAAAERLIVAPEALYRFYIDPPPAPADKRRVGATWMTREDRETDISDNVAYLDAVAAHVRTARTKRLRGLGFSQGCATAFRWAVLGKTKLDELIMWSGEVPTDVDMKLAVQRLAQTRIAFVYGARDDLPATTATMRHVDALREQGIEVEVLEHAGGHHLDPNLLATLANRI